MNMGITLTPALADPFDIIEINMAEKNAVIPKLSNANILKSSSVIPASRDRGINETLCAEVKSTLDVRLPIITINCDESANKKGAINTQVKVMKIV